MWAAILLAAFAGVVKPGDRTAAVPIAELSAVMAR